MFVCIESGYNNQDSWLKCWLIYQNLALYTGHLHSPSVPLSPITTSWLNGNHDVVQEQWDAKKLWPITFNWIWFRGPEKKQRCGKDTFTGCCNEHPSHRDFREKRLSVQTRDFYMVQVQKDREIPACSFVSFALSLVYLHDVFACFLNRIQVEYREFRNKLPDVGEILQDRKNTSKNT